MKSTVLDELRAELRQVDNKIIDLVAERLKIIKEIGLEKKRTGLQVLDSAQERKNLQANITHAGGRIPPEMVEELTQVLIDWSRSIQIAL